jgi:hypothetical protein
MTGDYRRITVLFTLAGAALGVLLAMLFFSGGRGEVGEFGHTDVRVSGLLTLGGAAAGGAIGWLLVRLSTPRPWAARWAVSAGVVLLTATLGSAAGWLVGDFGGARNWIDHEALTRRGASVGGVIGAWVGLLVLLPSWLK